VLVFDTDDDAGGSGQLRQAGQRLRDAVEARFGLHRAPEGKHAHDARAGAAGNLERAARQPRLIRERVLGGEHVLLEARIDLGRVRQHAFEHGGRDGYNCQAVRAEDRYRAVHFLVRQIDDVLA